MKGVLNSDHIPVNNYVLRIQGMPAFTFVTISGIEEELEAVDLPDRTAASGGHTKTIEFTATLPLHHRRELGAMHRWYQDSQDPVAPNYKKNGTLILMSISGLTVASFLLEGIFPCNKKTADLDMANEGEMHNIEWKFKGDRIRPLL
jgi:hypothetical protein